MNEAMTTCERRNKWIGGCKFEPRYHTEPPQKLAWELSVSLYANDHIRALTRKVYVCDVCTRCGKATEERAGVRK